MPKDKGKYTPSPWKSELNEEIKERIRMPAAIVGALYRLQEDRQEVEYGGAIDFEIVSGQPAVERVLTYTGLVKSVPSDVWNKVFRNPDIELTFHTHPNQDLAIPSEGDIMFFLTTEPSAMLIFAEKEAILLSKGPQTPTAEFARAHLHDYEVKAYTAAAKRKITREEQDDIRKEMKDLIGIYTTVYPSEKPIDLTLKVVREAAREGPRLRFFK